MTTFEYSGNNQVYIGSDMPSLTYSIWIDPDNDFAYTNYGGEWHHISQSISSMVMVYPDTLRTHWLYTDGVDSIVNGSSVLGVMIDASDSSYISSIYDASQFAPHAQTTIDYGPGYGAATIFEFMPYVAPSGLEIIGADIKLRARVITTKQSNEFAHALAICHHAQTDGAGDYWVNYYTQWPDSDPLSLTSSWQTISLSATPYPIPSDWIARLAEGNLQAMINPNFWGAEFEQDDIIDTHVSSMWLEIQLGNQSGL